MKKFTIELTQELVDYVQRVGYEVDTRVYLIDRMFDMHKNDTDLSFFDSVPFKKYHEELEQKKAEYDMAVKQLGEKLKPVVCEMVGREDVNFNFEIPDFNDLKAYITVLDEKNVCVCAKCANGGKNEKV